jgi:hypothetical protein
MTREAPSRGGRFVGVGWYLHGLLVYSRVFLALRWMMLEKVLRVAASWGQPSLEAKPPQVGADVDRASRPLHRW